MLVGYLLNTVSSVYMNNSERNIINSLMTAQGSKSKVVRLINLTSNLSVCLVKYSQQQNIFCSIPSKKLGCTKVIQF